MRRIFTTPEFDDFLSKADDRLLNKIDYLADILRTEPIITSKFAKKLVNTNLYELRIRINNNEYRILTYTIDHQNINQSKWILFISCFMKKSTKDYDKEIKNAYKILEQWKK